MTEIKEDDIIFYDFKKQKFFYVRREGMREITERVEYNRRELPGEGGDYVIDAMMDGYVLEKNEMVMAFNMGAPTPEKLEQLKPKYKVAWKVNSEPRELNDATCPPANYFGPGWNREGE